MQRLCEIVSWPESRIPAHERQLAADILVGLLRTSSVELRKRCADGLVRINDAPKTLLRYLARDEIAVALSLLEGGVGFDDSDLIATARAGVTSHWHVLARRRGLSEPVTDALLQTGDIATIEAVLAKSNRQTLLAGRRSGRVALAPGAQPCGAVGAAPGIAGDAGVGAVLVGEL